MTLVRYTPASNQSMIDLANERKVKSFTSIVESENKDAGTVTLIVTMPADKFTEPSLRVENVPVDEIEEPK